MAALTREIRCVRKSWYEIQRVDFICEQRKTYIFLKLIIASKRRLQQTDVLI